MILDSSAIVSVFFQEPGYEGVLDKLQQATQLGISGPTMVECGIVISARLNQDARALLARFLGEFNIAIIPFTEDHYTLALGAWLKYGKGRHPARLNFGDCLSYAASKYANEPLLFVGEDFSKTDLSPT
ncbi:MAG: type II toxin-antitoxin system VapC family toxin [Chloroflexota bacterium]